MASKQPRWAVFADPDERDLIEIVAAKDHDALEKKLAKKGVIWAATRRLEEE